MIEIISFSLIFIILIYNNGEIKRLNNNLNDQQREIEKLNNNLNTSQKEIEKEIEKLKEYLSYEFLN